MKQNFACILAVLLTAGLGCQHPIQHADAPDAQPLYEQGFNEVQLTPETSLKDVGWKNVSVTGELTGKSIRLSNGKDLSHGAGLNDTPLAIEFGNQSLSIVPDTEEIALMLLEHTNHRVTLHGPLRSWTVEGRGGNPTGQMGYRGPIPDHKVYFIVAESCRLLDEAEH